MTNAQAHQLPLSTYLRVCVGISALGWLPVPFTQPMMHGGTLVDVVLFWTGVVLGGYATVELLRFPFRPWVRILLALWLLPYVVIAGAGLYFAAPYLPKLIGS